MAKEVSLNEPLSGAEIKEIIIQRITEALNRNCTLTDDIAYPGFWMKFQIDLKYTRSTTEKSLVWGENQQGTVGPDDQVEGFTEEYSTDSPNTARQDHDMGVPVLVQTPEGPKRRKVKFQKGKQDGKQTR